MAKKITIEFSEEDAEMLISLIQHIFEVIELSKTGITPKKEDPPTEHQILVRIGGYTKKIMTSVCNQIVYISRTNNDHCSPAF